MYGILSVKHKIVKLPYKKILNQYVEQVRIKAIDEFK